jgi:SAM-dependent methyltransferase
MGEQTHQSDPRVLNERTLEADHRRLAALLCGGMSVLDVGCGTGAITVGIARAVGPGGRVVGVDRDESLLDIARRSHDGTGNLLFECAEALTLPYEREFDIVTAARTLQWISRPAEAIASMYRAAKPGGRVVVLDYNHQNNTWTPEPPSEFRRFYQALLDWRESNGWDNLMADHLPALFRQVGLADIHVYNDDETAGGGDPKANIWTHVIESLGPQLVTAGFLAPAERHRAEECFREWLRTSLERQTLELRTVVGTVV